MTAAAAIGTAAEPRASSASPPPVAVAISGSFRRGLTKLRADYDALIAAGCDVLSPQGLDFVGEENGFVFTAGELGRSPSDVEEAHLAAMRSADFVWLHAPDGYIGPSAAFELGVAATRGVPVFARDLPNDVALRHFVKPVSSPAAAVSRLKSAWIADPGAGVRPLQTYYDRIAQIRGWSSESAVESMVLLTEEVGELARAVREHVGLARRRADRTDPSEELADVQLYIVHLANILGVDLAAAVTHKEEENARRFAGLDAQTA